MRRRLHRRVLRLFREDSRREGGIPEIIPILCRGSSRFGPVLSGGVPICAARLPLSRSQFDSSDPWTDERKSFARWVRPPPTPRRFGVWWRPEWTSPA